MPYRPARAPAALDGQMSRKAHHVHASWSGVAVYSRARMPTAARAILSRALASRLGSTGTLPTSPEFEEVQGDRVRQSAGHRLVAHGVDLQLEGVPGTLLRPSRVPHVRRLVVGDGHALATEDPERGAHDVGGWGDGRCLVCGYVRTGIDGLDIHPVPSTAHAVAAQHEAELALDVRRDQGIGLQLFLAEPSKGRATCGEPCFLVLAAHETLVGPRGVEDLVQLRLRHDVSAGVLGMEELDSLVHGRAVDDRMVRSQRDA